MLWLRSLRAFAMPLTLRSLFAEAKTIDAGGGTVGAARSAVLGAASVFIVLSCWTSRIDDA